MASSAYNRYRFPDGKVRNVNIGDYGAGVYAIQENDDGSVKDDYKKPVSLSVLGTSVDDAFEMLRWMCKNRKRFKKYILRQRKIPFGQTIPDIQCKFPNVKRLKPLWKIVQARRLAADSKPKRQQLELEF